MLLMLQTEDHKISCGGAEKKEGFLRRLISVNVQKLSSFIIHTHSSLILRSSK